MFNMFKVHTITFMEKSNSHKNGPLLLKYCGWILFSSIVEIPWYGDDLGNDVFTECWGAILALGIENIKEKTYCRKIISVCHLDRKMGEYTSQIFSSLTQIEMYCMFRSFSNSFNVNCQRLPF